MDAVKFFRTIAFGAIAIGFGLLGLRNYIDGPPDPVPLRANPAAHARDPIALTDPAQRPPMTDFVYLDAENVRHQARDEWRERPVLIHFWATWCGPCLPELPGLAAVVAKEEGRLTVLPVSLDRDGIATVQKFLEDKPFKSLPVLASGPDFPIPSALPTSILVDRNGRIAWTTAGAHPWDGPDLDQALDTLTAETAAR